MKCDRPGRNGRRRCGDELDARGLDQIAYVSNPEFLREGRALADFMEPDRIVIGASDDADGQAVADLYADLEAPVIRTDVASAEMIKYGSNAFLATKISFINEIANVCEEVGADVSVVAQGMGLDERIGPHFLRPGIGFGGSCFPKDVNALKQLAGNSGLPLPAPHGGDRGERAPEAARRREARAAPGSAARPPDRAARPRLQGQHRRHARGVEPGSRCAPAGRGRRRGRLRPRRDGERARRARRRRSSSPTPCSRP